MARKALAYIFALSGRLQGSTDSVLSEAVLLWIKKRVFKTWFYSKVDVFKLKFYFFFIFLYFYQSLISSYPKNGKNKYCTGATVYVWQRTSSCWDIHKCTHTTLGTLSTNGNECKPNGERYFPTSAPKWFFCFFCALTLLLFAHKWINKPQQLPILPQPLTCPRLLSIKPASSWLGGGKQKKSPAAI